MERLRNGLRNMLGIRRRRALEDRVSLPSPGAKVVKGDLRMAVAPGLGEDLWRWLQNLGWREVTYRPDRRRYKDIPGGWVRALYDAEPALRDHTLTAACAAARGRNPCPPGLYRPLAPVGRRGGLAPGPHGR